MHIEAKAPTRIDLAGGTIDLWPLYLFLNGGITINLAINLYATASLRPLPEGKIEIVSTDQQISVSADRLDSLNFDRLALLCRLARYFAPSSGFRLEAESRVPAGSGLGGSSSLVIAVCGALNEFTGAGCSREELVGVSRDIEAQVLEIPTGEQDYYAAAHGGIHAWHFEVNRVRQETYSIPVHEIQSRILLLYSGLPRSSGINNWQVFKQYVDGDPLTRKSLSRIREAAARLHDALKRADWIDAFAAVKEEWDARKQLAPAISTPVIEEILAFGREHGSGAGKVCGAGGGGCLFLMMDPDLKPEIDRQARARGLQVLNFECAPEGLAVTRK